MTYTHTQHAPLHYLLFFLAAVFMVIAFLTAQQPVVAAILTIAAGVTVVLAFSFQQLTVEDHGDRLSVRFGPLPLFQTSAPYDKITHVQTARSTLIDGWGIHWVPGRGWTWNLWGFDCVEVTHNGRLLRIGTDDPQGLCDFLRGKILESSG